MSEENGVTVMNQTPKEIAAAAKPAPMVPKYFQIIPKDLSEAMKFAEMVAASDFVPKAYVGKAGNCLIAMQFGAELGLPPLQAIQNIAVINGKPGIYGDLGKALLYSKGFKIEERDVKEVQAKLEALCKITRPDGSVTERTFSKQNADEAKLWKREGPWTNYPYRMMAWRAFWWAARDAGADVLKGIWGIEELQDYKRDAIEATTVDAPKEITAEAAKVAEAVHKPGLLDEAKAFAKEVIDKRTGEIVGRTAVVGGQAVAVEVKSSPAEPPKNGLTPDQRKNLVTLINDNGLTPDLLRKHLTAKYGITDEKRPTAFVRQDQYAELCRWIENPQDELGV